MTTAIHDLLSAIGTCFGRLDNAPEGWGEQTGSLQTFDPRISAALTECFGPDSEPVRTYQQSARTYHHLIRTLAPEDQLVRGHLNLRFFIMLNGFLAACREAVEKADFDPTLNAAELVRRSYYAPYFFDRVTLTSEEVLTMLEEDIRQLDTLPDTPKGRAAAGRICKGTALALIENYCPLHPEIFPLAAELESYRLLREQDRLLAARDLMETIRNGLV